MTIKINPLIAGIVLMGIVLLIFGSIRSCNNSKRLLSEKDSSLLDISKKIINDSVAAIEKQKEYNAEKEFRDGQIELWKNKVFSKNDSLALAYKRIDKLLANHIAVVPSLDTSITTVPNEYVEDCEGCFSELKRDRDLVSRYEWSIDSLNLAYNNKMKLDSNRINDLNKQNYNLNATLNDAIGIAKRKEEKSRPRWKILFSLSTMAINANVPNAAGFGFGYQDKYNRVISVKYFASEYGSIKQADIFIPLSFKKR